MMTAAVHNTVSTVTMGPANPADPRIRRRSTGRSHSLLGEGASNWNMLFGASNRFPRGIDIEKTTAGTIYCSKGVLHWSWFVIRVRSIPEQFSLANFYETVNMATGDC